MKKLQKFFENYGTFLRVRESIYMRGEIYEKNISTEINLLRKITDYRGTK
jgi:hypothetical protein